MKIDAIERFDKRFDTATEPFIKVLKALEDENVRSHRVRRVRRASSSPAGAADQMIALFYLVALALSIYHFLPSIDHSCRAIYHNLVARNQKITSRSSDSFLVGIFSEDNEQGSERRKILRDYYKRHSSPRVCSLDEYRVQDIKLKAGSSSRICEIAYTFVVGSKDGSSDDAHPSFPYRCVESDCTHLDVDDGLEAKGQAFLEYVSSLSLSFDSVAKMDDSSFYAAILSSVGDMWSLSNKSDGDRINRDGIKTRFMHFVDANHPPDDNNRLIYGSHSFPSRSKGMFVHGQDFFMTMELVDFIVDRIARKEGMIAISRYVLSHLQPKDMMNFNRKRMSPTFEYEQNKMKMPKT